MNIITLNHKNVNQFWELRLCLLRKLGEISTETNLTDLEKSTKEYFLSNINKSLICYGIIDNDEIISIASLCLFNRIPYQENLTGKEGYILNVFTTPEFREQGLAKLLLQEIIKYAKNNDIKKLWLNSSEHGKHLYSSLGFVCKNNEMELI
ncbi:N-acetyltransferase [Phocaeicola plebeius]|uniref:GNAT family N-acetyltransferase n=1 Tax=Phocaeicola plebeius TaxID=310297 RepID=UPI000E514A7C|nr:GNAT family N-acetyltransferase [Phocaeicola plebeius]RHJ66900.1 GNAT family N-acetyltransferase [Phocaeicola plebeius]